MSLIDREAVLALPRNRIRNMRGEIVEETINVAYVEQLPSAQPYTEVEIQKMQDLYQAEIDKAFELGREDGRSDIVRCKDCKYFEYDHLYIIQDIPVIGHLVCNKWGDGCRTDENGFCFMGERRTDEKA